MPRRRSTEEGGARVRRIGWWALAIAVGAHGVLLLGLRVPREKHSGRMWRRALIWETQPQRLHDRAIPAARIAGIHCVMPRETPTVEKFSTHVNTIAQCVPAIQVVPVVVYMPGSGHNEAPGRAGVRKGHAMVWQIEAEGELAEAVMRAWQQRAPMPVTTNYTPRAPVVLEMTAWDGGVVGSVRITHSSGDTALDDAAREMAASLRLAVPRRGRPEDSTEGVRTRARVVVTIEPED